MSEAPAPLPSSPQGTDPETAREIADLIVAALDTLKGSIDGETKAETKSLRAATRTVWARYIGTRSIAITSGVVVAVASLVYVGQSFFSEAWRKKMAERRPITPPVAAVAPMKGGDLAPIDNGRNGHGQVHPATGDPSFASRFRA